MLDETKIKIEAIRINVPAQVMMPSLSEVLHQLSTLLNCFVDIPCFNLPSVRIYQFFELYEEFTELNVAAINTWGESEVYTESVLTWGSCLGALLLYIDDVIWQVIDQEYDYLILSSYIARLYNNILKNLAVLEDVSSYRVRATAMHFLESPVAVEARALGLQAK